MNLKNSTANIFKNVKSHDNYLEIEGGEFLKGNIKISGAKNSALVLMAASILSRDQINLFNVPRISDVLVLSKILTAMGVKISSNANQLRINAKEISPPSQDLSFDLFRAPGFLPFPIPCITITSWSKIKDETKMFRQLFCHDACQ